MREVDGGATFQCMLRIGLLELVIVLAVLVVVAAPVVLFIALLARSKRDDR